MDAPATGLFWSRGVSMKPGQTVYIDGRIDEAVDRNGIGYVDLARTRSSSRRHDGIGDAHGSVVPEIGDDHDVPCWRESVAYPASDARATAGDDDDLSREGCS